MKVMKYGFLCFIPMLLGVICWSQLPTSMAMHSDVLGNVNGVASRYVFVFGLPFLGFIGHGVYMWLLAKNPAWIGRKGFRKYSVFYMPILTACVMALLYVN